MKRDNFLLERIKNMKEGNVLDASNTKPNGTGTRSIKPPSATSNKVGIEITEAGKRIIISNNREGLIRALKYTGLPSWRQNAYVRKWDNTPGRVIATRTTVVSPVQQELDTTTNSILIRMKNMRVGNVLDVSKTKTDGTGTRSVKPPGPNSNRIGIKISEAGNRIIVSDNKTGLTRALNFTGLASWRKEAYTKRWKRAVQNKKAGTTVVAKIPTRVTSPLPIFQTMIPRVTSPLPTLQTMIPRVTSPLPNLPTMIPRVSSPLPNLPTMIPRVTSPLPTLQTMIPRVTSPLPNLPTMIPRVSSPLPTVQTMIPTATFTQTILSPLPQAIISPLPVMKAVPSSQIDYSKLNTGRGKGSYTVSQLKNIAKSMGIPIKSKEKKADIISKIKQYLGL